MGTCGVEEDSAASVTARRQNFATIAIDVIVSVDSNPVTGALT